MCLKRAQGLFVHARRTRRQRGNAQRGANGLGLPLVGLDDAAQKAPSGHLGGIESGGLQQHLARGHVAHRAGHQGRLARRHRKAELGDGRAKARAGFGDADVAAAGDLHARAHAGASNARDDGHVAGQHGRQAAPDVVFVKVTQLRDIEAKVRVLGDVTARAERLPCALYEHAAHVNTALNALENRAQVAPHGAAHGVQPPIVAQRHAQHAAAGGLLGGHRRDNFTRHAIALSLVE